NGPGGPSDASGDDVRVRLLYPRRRGPEPADRSPIRPYPVRDAARGRAALSPAGARGWEDRALSAPLKTGEESRMREPYGEDPASHPDPESCARTGDGAGEALTGAHAGPVSSCEIRSSGVPTRFSEAEGHTGGRALGERPPDRAQSETRCL